MPACVPGAASVEGLAASLVSSLAVSGCRPPFSRAAMPPAISRQACSGAAAQIAGSRAVESRLAQSACRPALSGIYECTHEYVPSCGMPCRIPVPWTPADGSASVAAARHQCTVVASFPSAGRVGLPSRASLASSSVSWSMQPSVPVGMHKSCQGCCRQAAGTQRGPEANAGGSAPSSACTPPLQPLHCSSQLRHWLAPS
jgi:hypothetical protein